MALRGSQRLDLEVPVCHLSYYEAQAYAEWAEARLPDEGEWEVAATAEPVFGNFAETGSFHPQSARGDGGRGQWFGDTWEWTQSAYLPYPRYRAPADALGEYNGKFMNGQRVLRGGSCATPRDHVRLTYRNFFQPEKRWQFTGFRLAWDL